MEELIVSTYYNFINIAKMNPNKNHDKEITNVNFYDPELDHDFSD